MDLLETTIELLNEYLKQLSEPISSIDFLVIYVLPIIQVIVLVGGAITGLYKYFKTKNQEIYQRLLSEVYAPLYQYFVKQELVRKITKDEHYKEKPILEYCSATTQTDCITNITQVNNEYLLGLNREELIKVLDSINIGLASRELYTLLSMYKVLVHFDSKPDSELNKFENIAAMKLDIENKLRREIVLGYNKYHKKLGIKGGIENDFLKIKNDEFIFKFNVDDN